MAVLSVALISRGSCVLILLAKEIQNLSHTIVLLYVAKNNVICNARGKQME